MNRVYKARVPTNIAFLKYWGKSDEAKQWPTNDSLSMTLDLFSETLASRTPLIPNSKSHSYSSHQDLETAAPFLRKGIRHLQYLAKELGFVEPIFIQTHNEFPSSCGIASSASGLGALTLAAIACWTNASDLSALESQGFTRKRLAALARLGSGSACRSFWGGFVQWQRGDSAQTQTVLQVASEKHWALRDCVVIVSSEEKAISSTEGHRRAQSSDLFEPRLLKIPSRLRDLKSALIQKDIRLLGPILEEEALEMHEVMASSKPACEYRTEATYGFLEFLKKRRKEDDLAVYFTLDAGPNIHLIYEEKDRDALATLVQDYKTIDVGIGSGPSLGIVDL